MKYNGDNNNINKFKFSTMTNFNKNLTVNKIKRNKTPLYNIKKDNYKKLKINDNTPKKYKTSYQKSICNINSLLSKMNSLKQLMYNTSDLKSMLVLDQYGLKYSNDLRKNINSAKKYMNSPNSPKNIVFNNLDNYKKKKSVDMNLSYFRSLPNRIKNNDKKRKDKDFNHMGKIFDLTNISKTKKEKTFNQTFLENEKKEKKLFHLKTELFLLEQKNKIKDVYVGEEKLNQNLTFIRDDIKHYSRVKSKYKRNIKTKPKKNILLKMYQNNNNKFKKINTFSKNTLSNNYNNMIQIQINEKENEYNNKEIEESIKPNKKILYYKEKINSYKAKKDNLKNKNQSLKNSNINENSNKTQIKYDPKSCSIARPNISLINNYINPKIINNKNTNINKISITHLTTSNNSQENTSLNSLSSSAVTNDMFSPKYKNSIKLTKNNIIKKNKNIISGNINNRSLIKPKKQFFINKLNNIMDKSKRIKNTFMNTTDEAKIENGELFKKHKFNNENEPGIDIKKINNYFNFSNREEINEEIVTKEKVDKVKAIMDKKCSKILDGILNEILFRERRLHRDYFGLSSYEKKLLKIKREDEIKKLGNESVLMEKNLDKDKILDVFIPENEEMINLLKDKKSNDDNIEELYEKSRILKHI